MASAQNAVNAVQSTSVETLNASIGAIQAAEAACLRAGRKSETKELKQARERLLAHLQMLEERNERKRREMLTPAQLETLAREGDPNCPKGQAYRDKATAKEFKCVGPQPVEMNWEQARRYFSTRKFRVVRGADEASLILESGAERYDFLYRQKMSDVPPYCVVIYSKPGVSWQEAVARNTGVPPERLKDGGVVATAQGKLPLRIDEKNQIARLGDCSQ